MTLAMYRAVFDICDLRMIAERAVAGGVIPAAVWRAGISVRVGALHWKLWIVRAVRGGGVQRRAYRDAFREWRVLGAAERHVRACSVPQREGSGSGRRGA